MAPSRRSRFGAVVLAGGYSSRMGRFKPLMPLGGSTVLARAIASFRRTAPDICVVVGHRGDELRREIARLGARCVENPAFDRGMFTSLVAGVRALPAGVDGCFVLPADMPAVRPFTARLLARAFTRTGADVVHPAFRGERGHPPVLSARLFGEILSGDEGARGGLRAILARHEERAVQVDVLDEGILLDLDTAADHERAGEVLNERTAPTPAEAWALLAAHGAPEHLARHSAAVAEIACRLADALVAAGVPIDRVRVRAAGLLHDVAKGTPDHARAGARIVRRLGYPAVAAAIAQHTDIRLVAGAPPDEAALVYLADKLVRGDRVVGLDERFRAALAAHGDDPDARAAIVRRFGDARAIAGAVEALSGIDLSRLAGAAVREQEVPA